MQIASKISSKKNIKPKTSPQKISNTKAIIVYLLAALFLCFEMALQISPGVMTPELQKSLNLSHFTLGIISGVYFITYTFMQIPSGMMYDKQSIRKILATAIFLCSLGAIGFSFSLGAITAGVSRMFMGFGSAFAFISVLTVSARFFQSKYFALLTGIAQLLAAIGGMAGGLPIAWLVEQYTWRHTMLLFSIIGFTLMILVLWIFNDLPNSNTDKTNNISSKQKHTIKKTNKQNNPGLFKNILVLIKSRQHWYAFIYAFFNWAPVIAFAELWGVPFLKTAYNLSTQEAAGLCSFIWLGIGITAPIIGALSDYIHRRNILLAIPALIGGIAIYALIYMNTQIHTYAMLAILLFLTGLGSAGQILSFAVVQDNTPSKRISTAIGLNNMGVVASGIIFQPLIGKLMMLFENKSLAQSQISVDSIAVYHKSLAIVPLCFLICVIIALFFIKETKCQPSYKNIN